MLVGGGSKAARAALERAIEAATVRSVPIAEAERLGFRDKAHRFARSFGAHHGRDALQRIATKEESWTMPTTVTLRRTTIEEIEIRTDEEPARDVRPGAVIDLAARALESLRGARRIGPRPARRAVDTTAKPVLAIADGRSDR